MIDEFRNMRGLKTISEIQKLVEDGNNILDPFSFIVSKSIEIASNNTFFPGVCLISSNSGLIKIGSNNVFHSNAYLEASVGQILIGSSNQFGTGGFSANANRVGSCIRIGDNGRYVNNPQIYGVSELGSGSQILGPIQVTDCVLESGDSFLAEAPDRRAGLLKGFGTARNLTVRRGYVITGNGTFNQLDMLLQSLNH